MNLIEEGMKKMGRASMEDLATELSQVCGGARGMALLWHQTLFASTTRVATKAKMIQNLYDFIGRTSKQYGDRAKLHNMDKEQIEKRLCELLTKHKLVIPIGSKLVNGAPEAEQAGSAGDDSSREDSLGKPAKRNRRSGKPK